VGAHLTQCDQGRDLPPYQVDLDPPNRLATTDMGRKLGAAVPLLEGAGFPSNTMWHGPMPTPVPSGILIHAAIWSQCMGQSSGDAVPHPFLGERGPNLTQCRLGRGHTVS